MFQHYSSLLDKSLSDAFIANDAGCYHVSRAVSANEIIQAAKALLSQRFQGLVSLVNTQEIKDFLLAQLSNHAEILAAVFLDAKDQVIAFELVFSGIVDSNPAFVSRQVARRALELNAQKIILAHHVLADQPRPVQADKTIAVRVQAALAAVEIELFDFYVVSRGQVISLVEWGFLKKILFPRSDRQHWTTHEGKCTPRGAFLSGLF